jgi:hypothetical protein
MSADPPATKMIEPIPYPTSTPLHARRMDGMTIWLQRLNLGLLASVIAGLDPAIHFSEQ